MFESVLGQGVVPRTRLGTGAAMSVAAHGVVLFVALLVPPPEPDLDITDILFVRTPPFVLLGGRAPGGGAPPQRTHRRHRSKMKLHAIQALVPEPEPETETEEPVVGALIDGFGGRDGDGSGTGSGPGSPGGTCTGGACDQPGMQAPVLAESGREPVYTREALEARVEGVLSVVCIVTLEGRVEECQVRRSLPQMDRAVIDALMTRRYSPATLDGKPVAVRYAFKVRLVVPR